MELIKKLKDRNEEENSVVRYEKRNRQKGDIKKIIKQKYGRKKSPDEIWRREIGRIKRVEVRENIFFCVFWQYLLKSSKQGKRITVLG